MPKKKKVVEAENLEVKKVKKAATPAKKKASVKKATVKKSAKINIKAPKEIKVKKKSDAYLMIDHPVESENVVKGHYAIRLGASKDGAVELSFNNGEWNPCRWADGYWWFDWVYFTPGDYKISARMIGSDGDILVETEPRICKVI